MSDASSNLAEVSAVCPDCSSLMPPDVPFCPGCGRAMRMPPMRERVAAAISYLTLAPAVVLLFLPQFRNSRFVRFHAWQSILLWAAFLLATMVALFLSNVSAAIFFLLIGIVAMFGMFFIWVVLTVKAFQGDQFQLPFFGMLAMRLR